MIWCVAMKPLLTMHAMRKGVGRVAIKAACVPDQKETKMRERGTEPVGPSESLTGSTGSAARAAPFGSRGSASWRRPAADHPRA